MIWVLYGLLFVITVIFFLLQSSFESFSRISLAKFIHDFASSHKLNQYYIEKYDLVFHSLKTFVFILQVLLLIFSFYLLQSYFSNLIPLFLLLLIVFLMVFYILFYWIGYEKKETIFKNLFFLFPLIWYTIYPLNRIFSLYLKETRLDEKLDEDDELSEEELEVFFEESTKDGVIAAEDKEMIQSVLEFKDTLVKEIMTPRVDMIYFSLGAKLTEIIDLINEHKKSRYPVVMDRIDNVEGIILSKDIFSCWNSDRFNIRELLRPPFFIPETMRVFELLKEMQKIKQHFAIVIDEFGGVSGLVTMEDIIEEIVGEIRDEYDDDQPPLIKEKDYYIARGDANFYEFCEELGIETEEAEEYQTIAGLISFNLGKIPQLHDRISFHGWSIEVSEIDKNRIKKVRIVREKD